MKTRSLLLAPLLPGLLAASAWGGDAAAETISQPSPELLTFRCIQLTSAPIIASAYPVVPSGSTFVAGSPEVGNAQTIEVEWSTPTAPPNPFIVRVAIPGANVDTWVGPGTANPVTPGETMKLDVPLNIPGDSTRPIPLDGAIPFTVTLDPTAVSGLPGRACTFSATYTPTGPAAAINLYQSQLRTAGIAVDATISVPAGSPTGTLYMGYPLSQVHQTVESTLVNSWSVNGAIFFEGKLTPITLGSGAFSSTTTGALPPFYAQNISSSLDPLATSLHAKIEVEVELSRVRVNRSILEQATWSEVAWDASGDPSLQAALATDAVNSPTDPTIVAFVTNTLGANYKTTYTPYDAASKLFVAVANALHYQGGTAANPTPSTAVAALAAGWGDCGDYGMLLTSVLRAVGIPTRIMYGQWPTGGGTHVINELWMPGAGWIPADATSSSTLFPGSGYPYFFGNVPALDIWVAFGFGNQYQGDGLTLDWLEGPGIGNTNVNVTNWTVTQTNDPAP